MSNKSGPTPDDDDFASSDAFASSMNFPAFPTFPAMPPFPPFQPFPAFPAFPTMPPFPEMKFPEMKFPKMATPEEIMKAKPSPNGSMQAVSINSRMFTETGPDGKTITKGGTTIVRNDNGTVTVTKVDYTPEDETSNEAV